MKLVWLEKKRKEKEKGNKVKKIAECELDKLEVSPLSFQEKQA